MRPELEFWRVEASSGPGMTAGIYELRRAILIPSGQTTSVTFVGSNSQDMLIDLRTCILGFFGV